MPINNDKLKILAEDIDTLCDIFNTFHRALERIVDGPRDSAKLYAKSALHVADLKLASFKKRQAASQQDS